MNEENKPTDNLVAPPTPSTVPPAASSTKNSGTMPLVALSVLGILLAIGAIAWASVQSAGLQKNNQRASDLEAKFQKLEETNNAAKTNNEDKIDRGAYQAVFLTSGQVYFGKLTAISDTQMTLSDIYYLRVNGNQVTPQNVNGSEFGNDISLVKLGNEMHGPQDTMYIERKETVFWENLKNDSQVVKAIEQYKRSNP